ncbi:acyl-CoA thioesterase/bile acid-CoA:amino acid N-acyltransferase family protein [Asanoa sp. WMMD1127]|uniref:acyl-CoA thioesterase/bile acid-CoA:amino acid N-acyltransferase family protein n=1 Tax=Asanoa sp. WMMD1127 TaxID=3016107 RepID=UPI002416BB1D|nr:acyl-CoA thioesterase/bile acid-CoA:amino acid N-acyltransferase family protein [Asanoa sp. WMMD1127]MDG4825789.1 acyl-CoA thioesterase/bile acid-CoA:amino acid N-acyltransferase family protein [Asanoa sp. WMMD1127]
MGVRRWLAGVAAVLVTGGGVVGCSAVVSTNATIEFDAAVALADQPIHVRVSGLRAGETVTVASQVDDRDGQRWSADATFEADGHGVVDLARSAPASGTYSGVDGMGLFWSMRPATGDPEWALFRLGYPEEAGAYEVRLTVSAAGREIAARTVTRRWVAPGVTHRTLTVGADGLAGVIFLPAPGGQRRTGVLLFGGSEGGIGRRYEAALLASRGHPTLALGYFGAPGLPKYLDDIPLEYFATAARLLTRQPGADPDDVVVSGYSRGSEAALLLAQHYPDLVHGTILYAPSDTVWAGYPKRGNAWTIDGEPVPQSAIPVTRVRGPVLAIAGGDDRVWSSAEQAQRIMRRLDDAEVTAAHQVLIYPEAGHHVGSFPYLPAGTIVGGRMMGGTRDANAAARIDSWPRVLALAAD